MYRLLGLSIYVHIAEDTVASGCRSCGVALMCCVILSECSDNICCEKWERDSSSSVSVCMENGGVVGIHCCGWVDALGVQLKALVKPCRQCVSDQRPNEACQVDYSRDGSRCNAQDTSLQ